MLKIMMAAIAASLIAISSATALPAGSLLKGVTQSAMPELLLVQNRRSARRDGELRRRNEMRRSYVPGRRYYSAPNGWNRYGSRRPGNWRSRNCIMVGPMWFCP